MSPSAGPDGDAGAVERARSFDRVAATYEESRPGYPAALLEALPLPRDATVLDLGAGTGKLTRVLCDHYREVIAVEPLDNMRAVLESVVPGADSRPGSAEAIPAADGSVDGVFAAQAFHWFSSDEAVAEVARVLRPGGIFAVVWNEPEEPTPLPDGYRERLEGLDPPFRSVDTDELLAPIARGPFGALQSAIAMHEQVQTRERVLGFTRSISIVAHRPEREREAIMAELGALLPEGEYRFPMRTTVRWAVRA